MPDLVVRDQREAGWCHIDNEILDEHGVALGAYGVAIYNVLCRYAKVSQQVSISNRDIAAILDISHDRVRKSLREMEKLNLVHVTVPIRPGPGLVSIITLLNVKKTGRMTSGTGRVASRLRKQLVVQASSRPHELDVPRPRNKERKTKTKQNLNTGITGLLSRVERERRQRILDATKRGLRDYQQYPREAWEQETA